MSYIVVEFDNAHDFQHYLNKTTTIFGWNTSKGCHDVKGNYNFLELIDQGTRGDKYFVIAYHHKEADESVVVDESKTS